MAGSDLNRFAGSFGESTNAKEVVMLNRIALVAILVSSISIGLAGQTSKVSTGEAQIVRLLGLEVQYEKMFTRSTSMGTLDGMLVVASTGVASDSTGQATLTRQFDDARENVIAYSWVPQNATAKRLTKQQVLRECGKPDATSGDALTYGRVRVAFNSSGQISEVTVHYNK